MEATKPAEKKETERLDLGDVMAMDVLEMLEIPDQYEDFGGGESEAVSQDIKDDSLSNDTPENTKCARRENHGNLRADKDNFNALFDKECDDQIDVSNFFIVDEAQEGDVQKEEIGDDIDTETVSNRSKESTQDADQDISLSDSSEEYLPEKKDHSTPSKYDEHDGHKSTGKTQTRKRSLSSVSDKQDNSEAEVRRHNRKDYEDDKRHRHRIDKREKYKRRRKEDDDEHRHDRRRYTRSRSRRDDRDRRRSRDREGRHKSSSRGDKDSTLLNAISELEESEKSEILKYVRDRLIDKKTTKAADDEHTFEAGDKTSRYPHSSTTSTQETTRNIQYHDDHYYQTLPEWTPQLAYSIPPLPHSVPPLPHSVPPLPHIAPPAPQQKHEPVVPPEVVLNIPNRPYSSLVDVMNVGKQCLSTSKVCTQDEDCTDKDDPVNTRASPQTVDIKETIADRNIYSCDTCDIHSNSKYLFATHLHENHEPIVYENWIQQTSPTVVVVMGHQMAELINHRLFRFKYNIRVFNYYSTSLINSIQEANPQLVVLLIGDVFNTESFEQKEKELIWDIILTLRFLALKFILFPNLLFERKSLMNFYKRIAFQQNFESLIAFFHRKFISCGMNDYSIKSSFLKEMINSHDLEKITSEKSLGYKNLSIVTLDKIISGICFGK